MDEIDFTSDNFADIVAKDARYHARAYALLMDCIDYLGRDGKHIGADEILDEFRERALDQYGPLTFTVLSAWGLSRTDDVGEMMMNLAEFHRVGKDAGDLQEQFCGGYDFREAFLGPYET